MKAMKKDNSKPVLNGQNPELLIELLNKRKGSLSDPTDKVTLGILVSCPRCESTKISTVCIVYAK